ncbi:MAG: ubiquinol-cytochrome c reductase iron-sulfur subunit [Aquabacterium sp.]|jgi:ubiquinol-cytochrome c reductase iron-sulfur subunit|uniref:ubiquinol-cytochrome c reductase iron-sulfur subunit n=1 Tax=Aquabacterium sp. TaxID=1872578 RepID=UPI002A366E89|nr:ubiquinol-cytochrome c reductase iron-sulfur subunit [Aquabacterium sp.]MDX9842764.1 ubiquinol-cytochrome c reductase iron-sulfur subunit [Aquabacterium sp.]
MSDAHSLDLQDVESRRNWLKLTTAAGGVAAVATAIPFVSTLQPSERAKAQGAAVEVDISKLAPGEMMTVEWRGKPVWVVRRTPEMLAQLEGHDQKLADPASEQPQQPPYAQNATRSIKPDLFLAVGICTHLGCSPSSVPAGSNNPSVEAGWPGGYFCPCHGSTFDGAGRVYKNKPAPTNLEVPPHRYVSDTRILIGEDDAKA